MHGNLCRHMYDLDEYKCRNHIIFTNNNVFCFCFLSFLWERMLPSWNLFLSSSSIVRYTSQIVINHISYVNIRSCHIKLDWTNFSQSCQIWIKLVKIGLKLSKLVQTCQLWIKLVKIGFKLSKLVQACNSCSKLVKFSSNLSKLV